MNKKITHLLIIPFSVLSLLLVQLSCESAPATRAEEKDPVSEVKKPEEVFKNNVRFEAVDIGDANPSLDKTVYYKLYINKELTTKTPPGLFFQNKKVSLNLSKGKHLLYVERWQLEKRNNNDLPEYYRANNIWQMKSPMYMLIPNRGITNIQFGYDHAKRSFYLKQFVP